MRLDRVVAALFVGLIGLTLGLFQLLVVSPGEAGAEEHSVTAVAGEFLPAQLEIASGDTVTWNNGGGRHNVKADDGSFLCARGCGDVEGGNGNPSTVLWSFSRVFVGEGDIPYHCQRHGNEGGVGMSGVISVPEPKGATLTCAALVSLAWLVRWRV